MAGSTGVVPSPPQAQIIEQKLRLEQALKAGASWFIWVAALSILNSVLSMTGAKLHFIFGMGVTQVVDALANRAGSTGIVLDLFINGIIAGVFVLFWNLARKGQRWAWIAGMVLYLLDGLILVTFEDWLGVVFHAYVLFRLFSAFKFLSAYESVKQQESMSLPPAVG